MPSRQTAALRWRRRRDALPYKSAAPATLPPIPDGQVPLWSSAAALCQDAERVLARIIRAAPLYSPSQCARARGELALVHEVLDELGDLAASRWPTPVHRLLH